MYNDYKRDFDGDFDEQFTLQDVYGAKQTLHFSETYACSKIRITINSVYKGSKWDDATISEINVF